MQKKSSPKPIEIKIATVVAVSAILRALDLTLLDKAMLEMTGGETDFFDGELAIIDIGMPELDQQDIDWPGLIALFRRYSLQPVAVRNAPPEMHPAILAHGLSIDNVTVAHPSSQPELAEATQPVSIAPAASQAPPLAAQAAAPVFSTMIIDTPVRAGQRIYARGADLIVTAAVNNGAEVIADGSIHVYAPLRGRALAGASGHTEARIFAMSMEAELVSIAGVYRTFENGLPADLARQLVQVRLEGDRIDILAVNPGI